MPVTSAPIRQPQEQINTQFPSVSFEIIDKQTPLVFFYMLPCHEHFLHEHVLFLIRKKLVNIHF